MATRKSSEVERRRSPVRRKRTRTRPATETGHAVQGSSRGGNRGRAAKASAATSLDVQSNLYDVLHHFSEALAIVETVSNALQAAQNNSKCTAVGSEIATLRHGVAVLVAVHQEFDLAFSEIDS